MEHKKFDFMLGFFISFTIADIKKYANRFLLRINELETTTLSVEGLYYCDGKSATLSHVNVNGEICDVYMPSERFGRVGWSQMQIGINSSLREAWTVPAGAVAEQGIENVKKTLQKCGLIPGIVDGAINTALEVALQKEDGYNSKTRMGRVNGVLTEIVAENVVLFLEQNHPNSRVRDFIAPPSTNQKNKKVDLPNTQSANPLLSLTPPKWGKA